MSLIIHHLSRYPFKRIPIRRRVQSPETNAQALAPSEPANMPAESRTRVNVRDQFIDTLSASKEWMVCGVGSTSPVTAVVISSPCHNSCDDFCQSFNDMVISLWYHQNHGARASIEGGFFESNGPAVGVRNTPRLRGDVIGEFCRFSENELKLCM